MIFKCKTIRDAYNAIKLKPFWVCNGIWKAQLIILDDTGLMHLKVWMNDGKEEERIEYRPIRNLDQIVNWDICEAKEYEYG